jgi:hypothetical protein
MEVLWGILLLAALGVVIWLWNRAKDAAWKAANQKVLMRGAHRQGKEAVGTVLIFDTAASAADVLEKVEGFGWPREAQSSVMTNVYVPTANDRAIVFVSGSRLLQSFRSLLTLTATEGGTRGAYRVLEWKEGDGIVGDIKQMQAIEERLRRAVSELDAHARFMREDDLSTEV